MKTYRLGVDVGGTFTDFVLVKGNAKILLHKRLSTPDDPSRGVLAGIRELCSKYGLEVSDLGQIIHGTTVVANALIERKGDRTGLITTSGFRDALEIAREVRYDIYDLAIENPEPLVPRYLRYEVDERTLADGTIRSAPQDSQVAEIVAGMRAQGVTSVAVCLLHAHSNAANENAIAGFINGHAPGMHVTLSSQIAPEIREYERMSTTVASAYVHPLVSHYLQNLETELASMGFAGRLLVMLSHGGVAAVSMAREKPVQLVESGPAAGAQATGYLGRRMDIPDLLAFDMGGTTAKACIVEDGEPAYTIETEVARIHRFKRGSGMPLRVPSVDMIEIGAGGGSIARLDHIGMLKVGPESAGADPGPACYALGGTEPTVTDANLVLGYLDADSFLGGTMRLDKDRALKAMEDHVGEKLGMSGVDVAAGIVSVANENMSTAARLYMAEHGKDPQRFALMAFGGGGPVHGYRVARALQLGRVIYPMGAGVLSAFGFLVAAPAVRLARSYVTPVDAIDWSRLRELIGDMRAEAAALLADADVKPADMTFKLTAELRYVGQGHEVEVEVPETVIAAGDHALLRDIFETAYADLFSMKLGELRVESMNWRLSTHGLSQDAPIERWADGQEGASLDAARIRERPIYIPDSRSYVSVPVYDRYKLTPGMEFEGPALVEERESTIVINGQGHATVDEFHNLIVELK